MAYRLNPVEGKYLSFSSIDLYNQCPFKYEQQYVQGKRSPSNIFLVIGICLHNIVECAYVHDEFDPNYWEVKVKKMYHEVASKQLPSLLTKDNKGEYMQGFFKTKDLVTSVLHLIKKNGLDIPIPAKFIETKLKGKALGWKIGGKSDLIIPDSHPDYKGYNLLLDIKSSQKESETHHKQVMLYREMAPRAFNIKRVGILYPALNKLVITPESYRKSMAEYLKAAIDGLNKREFEPKRNNYCKYCHVKEPCPIYKNRPKKKK